MITSIEDEDSQIVDDRFVIPVDDDPSAFFNLGIGNLKSNNNNQNSNQTNFGGFKGNGFRSFDTTVFSAPSSSDPSAKCNKNCNSCVWSMFCKNATKGLSSLGGAFVPRLG